MAPVSVMAEVSKDQYLAALRQSRNTVEVLCQIVEHARNGFPITIAPGDIVLPPPPRPEETYRCFIMADPHTPIEPLEDVSKDQILSTLRGIRDTIDVLIQIVELGRNGFPITIPLTELVLP